MEVRRLEYFVSVAETGSLGRASDVLRIAQPALTRQVRLLEQELGVTLFTRTRRGMRLTEEGEHLLADVVGPLRQLRGALQNVRSFSSNLSGNVAIGMLSTVACFLGQPLLERVSEKEPAISLRLVEGSSQHLKEWVASGELDAVTLYRPTEDDKLVTRELLTEEMVFVGSPASGLAPQRQVSFGQVIAAPLILPNPRNGLRKVSEKLAARHRAQMNIRYVVDSLAVLKDLVGAGFGYTILPRSAIIKEVDEGSLAFAPIENPITRTLVLATRPHARSPRILTRVDEMLHGIIRELQDAGRIVVATAQ